MGLVYNRVKKIDINLACATVKNRHRFTLVYRRNVDIGLD